jgi:hypothetical protein
MTMHITVSLKDALRERPGSRREAPRASWAKQVAAATTGSRQPHAGTAVTCSPFWTPEEFRTFRYLTDVVYHGAASGVQSDPRSRADAAVYLKRFTEKQGKEKCDMMLAELRRLDAAAWFKEKQS